jgi:hypothetical protein
MHTSSASAGEHPQRLLAPYPANTRAGTTPALVPIQGAGISCAGSGTSAGVVPALVLAG